MQGHIWCSTAGMGKPPGRHSGAELCLEGSLHPDLGHPLRCTTSNASCVHGAQAASPTLDRGSTRSTAMSSSFMARSVAPAQPQRSAVHWLGPGRRGADVLVVVGQCADEGWAVIKKMRW